MSTTSEITEGPLDLNSMDELCRQSSCSSFAEQCSRLSYDQVYQVHCELLSRIANISHQLVERGGYDSAWAIKAKSARSILDQKLKVASHRLEMMRNNHISNLLDKVGGAGFITSKRLVMIKCLIHIIDHYSKLSSLSSEEKSVLDACRKASGFSDEQGFSELSYDSVTNRLMSDDGQEIAKFTITGSAAEEVGFTTASSFSMVDMLERAEILSGHAIGHFKCKEEDHDPNKCVRCYSENLHKDIDELLSKVK
jgi:hypothetical protein